MKRYFVTSDLLWWSIAIVKVKICPPSKIRTYPLILVRPSNLDEPNSIHFNTRLTWKWFFHPGVAYPLPPPSWKRRKKFLHLLNRSVLCSHKKWGTTFVWFYEFPSNRFLASCITNGKKSFAFLKQNLLTRNHFIKWQILFITFLHHSHIYFVSFFSVSLGLLGSSRIPYGKRCHIATPPRNPSTMGCASPVSTHLQKYKSSLTSPARGFSSAWHILLGFRLSLKMDRTNFRQTGICNWNRKRILTDQNRFCIKKL